MSAPLLLVGCGNMGHALLSGWLARGTPAAQILAVEPGEAQAKAVRALGVTVLADAKELPAGFAPALVLLAVKPQAMDAVAPSYARFAGQAVFLSIAAGKTIAALRRHLGAGAAIVRTMPNTPAAVARGITAACAGGGVNVAQRDLCSTLLAAVGEVVWVDDEAQLDAVTAVSGSGPAYVFLLIEVLEQAGVEAGLPRELAARLARATVSGSGELAHRASEPAAQLRRNVTSPGGTTQAALDVLMAADGLQPLMTRAIAAATRRSRELAS
jgi:pyrroline-5-carboxylate reductase